MSVKKFTFLLLLACIGLTSQAQNYGHMLLPGWRNLQVFELNNDTLMAIGLANKGPTIEDWGQHRIQFTKFSFSDSSIYWQDTFNSAQSVYTSIISSFAISKVGDLIKTAGTVNKSDKTRDVGLFSFDTNGNLIHEDYAKYGFLAHPLDIIEIGDTTIVYGFFQDDTTTNTVYSFFSQKKSIDDSITKLKDYTCFKGLPGGCHFIANQILKGPNESFVLAAQMVGETNSNIQDPLIVKIDQYGNELWRLDLGNDSTVGYYLSIAPLANGNYLALYNDYYYKLYKQPPNYNNRFVRPNVGSSFQCVEFDNNGKILNHWNLKQESEKAFRGQVVQQLTRNTHLIITKDSGIVVVGSTYALTDNGNEPGYILKLDKYGKFEWYRHHEININGGGGYEVLDPYGINELGNGGFALSCEYSSYASIKYPEGYQSAVVLFLDEFGCYEPGCQLKDGISTVKKQSRIKIYPNPSSGEVHFESETNDLYQYDLLNTAGKLIKKGSFSGTHSTDINSGIYFIRFTNSSNGQMSYSKLIVE
jgi:Secretion system C-terminal sorting domain